MHKNFKREDLFKNMEMPKVSNYSMEHKIILINPKDISVQVKTKENKRESQGLLKVFSHTNNTHLCFQSYAKKSFIKSSLGCLKKHSFRKKSAYASYILGQHFSKILTEENITSLDIVFRGFNKGQNDIINGLTEGGVKLNNYTQNINQPHNGCRPKKNRRL